MRILYSTVYTEMDFKIELEFIRRTAIKTFN